MRRTLVRGIDRTTCLDRRPQAALTVALRAATLVQLLLLRKTARRPDDLRLSAWSVHNGQHNAIQGI